MLTTSISTSTSVATSAVTSRHQQVAGRTPTSALAARAIITVQGVLVLGLGCLLFAAHQPGISGGIAVASIVEGLLRITVGICLRRGAHVVRVLALALCILGIVAGFAAGGVALIGAALSVVVGRCLNTTEAKAYFAR